jgi:ABC-2 type transport system permease protein
MPAVTFWYSELMPVTQYLEITRGIIVRGSQGVSLWQSSILPLIILSVGYFTASVLVFRKRI